MARCATAGRHRDLLDRAWLSDFYVVQTNPPDLVRLCVDDACGHRRPDGHVLVWPNHDPVERGGIRPPFNRASALQLDKSSGSAGITVWARPEMRRLKESRQTV